MRRLLMLLAAVLLLTLMALPAMAQEDGGEGGVPVEEGEDSGAAISITATVAFVSGGIAFVIEWLRGRFPRLDGDVLRALSLALALGAVWAWDLRVAADYGYAGLPDILDLLASGIVISFGAGFLGTLKNSLRAKDPTSSLHVPV